MKRVIFFILILLVGCKTEVVPHKPSLPYWYLHPPKDNKNFVYTTGEGITKKEAVLNALSNFISRYSVTISSKFESKSQDFGGGIYSKKSEYNLKAMINKFEISNYKVIKAFQYKFDKYLVLVKVNIKKLFNNLKLKFDNRFKSYIISYNFLLKENPLSRFVKLRGLIDKLQNEKNYIYILKMMNPDFNAKFYFQFINKVKKYYLNLQTSLKIEIICNNNDIKKDIEKFLSINGIKIGKSNIKLIADVKKRESNFNLIVYEIFMKIKYKNNIIGSNYFKIVLPKKASVSGYLYFDIQNLSLRDFFHLI